MNVRSLRRITHDSNHNAFTGAQWFQGALYVAFRQGDAHADPNGKIVIMRSRNEGISFDTVAVLRGEFDTRDAHLHAEGDRRLFVSGFEFGAASHSSDAGAMEIFPGMAWTDNGVNWSQWARSNGAQNYVMWRPRYQGGKHYCAGYTSVRDGAEQKTWSRVGWFESEDAVNWNMVRVLHEGEDQPNECALDFHADGTAVVLMRREHRSRKPLLLRAKPPYDSWDSVELDIPLAGPALWLAGDDIWISGRWFPSRFAAHVAVFRIVDDKPVLQTVLPSGPGFDCSYMGVTRHPLNQHRFFLSYYSNHTAPDDPAVTQDDHPDIYLADVTFSAEFIQQWKVSALDGEGTLAEAHNPEAEQIAGWSTLAATHSDDYSPAEGFVDASALIGNRAGVIYFVTDLEVGPCDSGSLHLGYDGPVRVWLNGEQVLEANGSNPAVADQTSMKVRFLHGANRLAIALDTNGGRACGIFARFERDA